ncbi:hypothetical protein FHR83_000383 [Actinoplanes campanulatus]|uniref:Uncharacterized protein n=1 Tax=Actinoplanes campanulatus TaxID=113559 RepID=A0A7W5AB89_9ACTN|nr:hypothetical protein [Actinoplanes campanulatus]
MRSELGIPRIHPSGAVNHPMSQLLLLPDWREKAASLFPVRWMA